MGTENRFKLNLVIMLSLLIAILLVLLDMCINSQNIKNIQFDLLLGKEVPQMPSLISVLRDNCLNMSVVDEALCIHNTIYKLTNITYSHCVGKVFNLSGGGCCRDWSWLFAQLYRHFGWEVQYITYRNLRHLRLDVTKENVYCVLDLRYISCFRVKRNANVG